jgi:hypothetical protein
MPTLIELFNSRQYQSLNNQTPKEAFAIRNSKTVPISSTDALFQRTAVPLVTKLRLGNRSERFRETRLEQENVGLFAYHNASQLLIYGTDIARVSGKSTPLLEAMKINTGGRGLGFSAAQVVGDTVGEAVKFAGSKALGVPATFQPKQLIGAAASRVRNTIGALIPDVLIPTRIATNPLFKAKVPGVNDEYRTHELLATIKNLSLGTRVAGVLARNATGTPSQASRQLVGQGLNIIQEETKRFVAKKVANVLSRGGEKAQQLAREISQNNSANIRYSSLRKYSDLVKNERDFGKTPLNFGNVKFQTADTDIKARNDLSAKWLIEYTDDLQKNPKLKFLKEKGQEASRYNGQDGNLSGYSQFMLKESPTRTKFGMLDGGDTLVKKGAPYTVSTPPSQAEKDLDNNDFVPLKFVSLATNTAVNFRGTITGLSEQFTPSWDNSRFIGSPFNFYTYQSIERSVQFTFHVFSLNKDEHKTNWSKLGFLASLCYPQSYERITGGITAPFLKLTLGDMYRNKECYIDSMTYNVDDDHPWEVGLNDVDVKNFRLPTIIEVTLTLKFIESRNSVYNFVTGSTNEQDKTKIGELMYGYRFTPEDVSKNAKTAERKQFKSTTKDELNTNIQKPNEELKQKEFDDAWDDDSFQAKLIRARLRLEPTEYTAYPNGSTTQRKIYVQKKNGQYFFGNGIPYTGFKYIGNVKENTYDVVENPLTRNSIAT